jgi:hypothetical protein
MRQGVRGASGGLKGSYSGERILHCWCRCRIVDSMLNRREHTGGGIANNRQQGLAEGVSVFKRR